MLNIVNIKNLNVVILMLVTRETRGLTQEGRVSSDETNQ